MKKTVLSFLLVLLFAMSQITVVLGEVDYTDPKQRNPQGDKDVERGYQEHQRQYREKQEEEKPEGRKDVPPFEVDRGGLDDADRKIKK